MKYFQDKNWISVILEVEESMCNMTLKQKERQLRKCNFQIVFFNYTTDKQFKTRWNSLMS